MSDMYPEQPTPPPSLPTPPPSLPPTQAPPTVPYNYLDQIAPQAPKRGRNVSGLKKIIFFGIIAAIIVGIVAITLNVIDGAQKEPAQKFAARLTSTQTIVEDSQDKLKSSELRSLNSDLKLYFTNTLRDAAEPLKRADVNIEKIDADILKKETALAEKMNERLEDARLNAIFDRTYAREMAYQLETLLALMQRIYASTKSESLKEYIDGTYKNLQPTQQALEAFNESTN